MNKSISFGIISLLFLSAICLPLFMHLEHLPFRLWDESRIVNNSMEMFENRDFLVTHYGGQPDMWSTKPPLLAWIQVAFIEVFGLRELSFRLPSAIFALLTMLALVWFSKKHMGNYWFGMIAALVLVTSMGYMDEHGVRTADFDSLLALNTTLYCIFFFLYLQTDRIKFLHLFFAFLSLAIFTKSTAGLLFLPGLGIFMLISKKFHVLKSKWLYIDALFSISLLMLFYISREHYNPGYIDKIFKHDFGLLVKTVENHKHSASYFLELFIQSRYSFWFWFLPFGIGLIPFVKDEKIKSAISYFAFLFITYLTIISFSNTKVAWYDIPLYPVMAMLVANVIYYVLELLKRLPFASVLTIGISWLFVFGILAVPYLEIIEKTYKTSEKKLQRPLYSISHYLRDGIRKNEVQDFPDICVSRQIQHMKPYVHMANAKGADIEFIRPRQLKAPAKVLVYQSDVKEFVEENFEVRAVKKGYFIVEYEVLGER